MGSLRPIISIYLLVVGALVALQMVFDSFYLGSADAIWGYLDWPIALAMLLAMTASVRRLVLAGVGDSPRGASSSASRLWSWCGSTCGSGS